MSRWSAEAGNAVEGQMDEPLRVFVYGSLKRGGEYHHLMLQAGGQFLAEGRLQVPYPLIQADYPRLMDRPGEGAQVQGELYALANASGWQILDTLEGHPHEYCRRLEAVESAMEKTLAWTYFYVLEENGPEDASNETV